jgi:hypothetical protein
MSNEIVNPFEPPKTLETAARVAVNVEDDFRARVSGASRGKRLAGWFLLASAAVSIVALFAAEMMVTPFGFVLDVIVGGRHTGAWIRDGCEFRPVQDGARLVLGLIAALQGTRRTARDRLVSRMRVLNYLA